ncbi:hypothetical protein KY290_017992 [Solanum tuberosum]|uniref:DUF4283 domain-containing protein n=1 Tax=Solanum tuberosum TaxID=4113 RepID=A0ABQ7VEB2_SOLTU|nr:hypothetical protein KY284_016962 [Solanum tuberosum]KAH0702683.1 hypothetical protein KY285_016961 [Solanum tuberosum]KAH0707321.1 hypothetical protein KY289_012397 [Solanum tuberosum]KAH0761919.1 hypothetical protein KY290_017992 [Solanum tuberosum]
MNLSLEWWNPTTVCWPEEITRDRVWIRILGLPLCLWSQNTFEQIGEQCSGYIETEEETSLKHHLHWARIKLKGDGKSIPPEIEVVGGGMVHNLDMGGSSSHFQSREREDRGQGP